MKPTRMLSAMITIAIVSAGLSMAQEISYTSTDDSYVIVRGTSTLHDWELRSETIMSEVVFSENGEGIGSLESVMFIVEKTTLESDRSRLQEMAHEEMEAGAHPEITFRSDDGIIRSKGEEYNVTVRGDITISGVTRNISVDATCMGGDEEMVCTGTRDLQMTDFGIEPPRLMLGALRTDDDITVEFRIVYTQ
jgi:hypothetical protein